MLDGAPEVPGQTGKDAGPPPILSSTNETSAMSSSPSLGRCSSYQMAAARSSARASGWSSTCTTRLELLQELHPRGAPFDRLDLAFCDLARSTVQLGGP